MIGVQRISEQRLNNLNIQYIAQQYELNWEERIQERTIIISVKGIIAIPEMCQLVTVNVDSAENYFKAQGKEKQYSMVWYSIVQLDQLFYDSLKCGSTN